MEELNEIEQPIDFPLEKPKDKGVVRAVIFTMFNYTAKHIQMIKDLIPEKKATFVVFQEEVTPKTNKAHLQGYIEFGKPTKWNYLMGTIGKMHVCSRKGTPQQCFDYCTKQKTRKEGTLPWQGGVMSKGSGSRSDLEHIQEEIEANVPMHDIAKQNFATWAKYRKSLDAYLELVAAERSGHTISIALWGASNSGKSRLAFELFKNRCIVDLGNGGAWWDLYQHQEAVIFDEFSGWIKFNNFKRLVDMHPTSCDGKGTTKVFNSRYLVWTSNDDPYGWYTMEKDSARDAFDKRIHINLEAVKHNNESAVFGKEKGEFYTCKIHRAFIPFGANLPHGWHLDGLTSNESRELIDFNTDDTRRNELVTRSVTRLRLRGAGVIISPALDKTWDFYTAAKYVLTQCLFLNDAHDGDHPSKAADNEKDVPGGLSSLAAKAAAAASPDLGLLGPLPATQPDRHAVVDKWMKNVLMPSDEEVDKEIQTARWARAPTYVPESPPEVRTQVPVQRAFKSAAKRAPPGHVRPDQRLSPRSKSKRSAYPRFGTNAFDESDDSENSGNRITRSIAKQRKRSAFVLDEADVSSDDPRFAPTESDDGEGDEYVEDDFLVGDTGCAPPLPKIPNIGKPPRRLERNNTWRYHQE